MKSIDENRLFYEFTYTKWDLNQWTVSCFTVFITVILDAFSVNLESGKSNNWF